MIQRSAFNADYPGFPLDLIEAHVIGWLEMEFAPPAYAREQLGELDRLTKRKFLQMPSVPSVPLSTTRVR